MKFRNLAIAFLAALLVVYCGATLFASVNIAVNAKESVLLGPTFSSKDSAARPSIIAVADPINDPRPH